MSATDAGTEPPRLSACIITLNEEDRIGDCLKSVAWCDEIVVVDAHSTDRTRRIAADMGARVIERDWPGFAAQKEFAVRQARHDWVLSVDADERLSPELRAEIEDLRERGFSGAPGWSMPRLSCYLGRWIYHGTWYPNRCLRLFDRRRGRFRNHRNYELHERVEVDGEAGRLRANLWHHPYRDLGDQLRSIDRYTTIMAQGLHRRGHRTGVVEIVVRPWFDFLSFYIFRRGFLDGWQGLLLGYMIAHSVRMKYAKLFALQRDPRSQIAKVPSPKSQIPDR
jgi:glycosyltransferase involved in cell wall biosynthesis